MHLLCNETALRLGYNLAIYVADCQLTNGSAAVHMMKSLVNMSAFTIDMHFLFLFARVFNYHQPFHIFIFNVYCSTIYLDIVFFLNFIFH